MKQEEGKLDEAINIAFATFYNAVATKYGKKRGSNMTPKKKKRKK